MPSPFPGMDPYLEVQGRWIGFHNGLVVHCSELLNRTLPEDYVAQTDERVSLVSSDDLDGSRRPDLTIGREEGPPSPQPAGGTAVGTLKPTTMQVIRRPFEVRDSWVEIFHLPEMELVTVIEVLSPTNKSGSGRVEYLAKREALLDRPVHLIEIDLLLGGAPMPLSGRVARGHYMAIIARAERRPDAEVYSWPLRHPLPVLPIPLRAPDPDIMLDLGEAFRETYDGGRYRRAVRYGRPLPENLPISAEDRAWAEAFIRPSA